MSVLASGSSGYQDQSSSQNNIDVLQQIKIWYGASIDEKKYNLGLLQGKLNVFNFLNKKCVNELVSFSKSNWNRGSFFKINDNGFKKYMFGTNSICYQRPKAGYKT